MPLHFHIAQVNVACLRAPLDDPITAGFTSQLRLINAIGDRSPGFVWRLQTAEGNATAIRAFDDPLALINVSVWESIEALRHFVYQSAHMRPLRDRAQWFVPPTQPGIALWWVPAGHEPTVEEAVERLELLRRSGPTAEAFGFDTPFAMPPMTHGQSVRGEPGEPGEHLRILTDRMPAIVWATDTAMRFTAGMGAGLAALGLEPDQLRGQTLADYFKRSDSEFLPIESHQRALAGEASDFEIEWADRVFQAHLEPTRDAEGTITGVIGVALDVTEYKGAQAQLRTAHAHLDEIVEEHAGELRRANERLQEEVAERRRAGKELRATQERLQFLLSATSAMIYAAEPTGNYAATHVTENVHAIAGYHPRDFLGNPTFWIEHVHPDDRAIVAAGVRRMFEHGYHVHEYRFLGKDGQYRWMQDGAKLVRDADGTPREIVGYWIDTTDRKGLEVELREAKEAAEGADRAKSDFLATISHEIRNPMNAIIESADLLTGADLHPDQQAYATIVRRSAEALLTIVDDILDLSKIEAHRLELHITRFSVASVVADVVDIFSARARMQGIELTAVTDRHVPSHAFGDPGRLRQILINLVGNAIKFTRRGEVTIRTTLAESVAAHARLRFEVRDTGIGIPRDLQGRLFQPFSQIRDAQAPRAGGTGLGLVISKRLAELMSGAIGVESEPGRGSTFWFTIILEGQPARDDERLRLAAAPAATRVLIVEDGATSRAMLTESLEALEFPAEGASTGTEGLARLRAAVEDGNPFALVLLDVEMPGLPAFEFIQMITRDPLLKGTRVVLLVPFGQLRLERAAREAGAAACFLKPLHPTRLRTLLETVLGVAPDESDETTARSAETSGELSLDNGNGGAGKRLLLVEDDEDLQLLTSRILERAGYAVDVVGDGREAIAAAAAQTYDLILMDSRLPGVDGFGAAESIRTRERSAGGRVPIVALTANASDTDRQRCLDVGMDEVLRKPVRPDRLVQTVRDWTATRVAS